MQHQVVSRDEWLAARQEFLRKEKEFTRLRDQLSAERRALPWVKVEKDYVFDGPNGKVTLAELFGGNSQLVVKHFMFGPDWQEGCVGCSFEVDQVQGALVHLRHHDVSYAAVSRAPFAKIEAFRRRSPGCRRSATTSTAISMCRSHRTKSPAARPSTTTGRARR
jgi:predicted dithiol-disulfide oxidoreductase (DUF899 family)